MPTSHLEQCQRALVVANAVRSQRAVAMGGMHALPKSESLSRAAELIECPPPELDSMLVERFLARVRGLGPVGAMRMVRATSTGPMTMLGRLTPRQREALAMSLRRLAGAVS